ncbi:MAG: riboflavin biosynthesis protein RibF [Dysgonamonadaceae bacterium]|jgi:riboflavin kinase/FMN adenylyltransferase|nr:riboflavin biosynthesis protein RibF [Dysgonamonadaceae bacterium]
MKIVSLNKDLVSEMPEGEFAATIGFFDGVHRGHRFLIEQLQTIAVSGGLPSVVITFPVHPRKVLQSDYQPQLLNNFEEKLFQLSTTGADYCFILDFTKELSELTAGEFIKNKLRKELHVKELIVGYDHRFGKGRADGFKDYQLYGRSCGMEVIQARQLKENELHISSTSIRNLLSEGDVQKASSILSYNYTLEGRVITGNQMGRKMGFPTANLQITEPYKVIPSAGIYATIVHLDGQTHSGMTYIGGRPTFVSGGEQRIETHILDFVENIYEKELKIEFVRYIRENVKFDTIKQLEAQLQQDEIKIRNIFE